MPTGYTAEIYDGKDMSLAGFVEMVARGFLLELRDEGRDAPLPATCEYKVAVIQSARDAAAEALDEIYELEGMTDAQCEQRISEEHEKRVAELTGWNVERAAVGERYTAMIAKTEAWVAPAPLAEVKRFMLEQLRQARSFDANPFDLPKPPPPVAEWRAKRMERLRSWHADKLADVEKQTQAKKEGDEFRATLVSELARLRSE